MTIADVVLLIAIVGGVGLLVYKTIIKPKSFCPGCDGCSASAVIGKSSTSPGADKDSCGGSCCR